MATTPASLTNHGPRPPRKYCALSCDTTGGATFPEPSSSCETHATLGSAGWASFTYAPAYMCAFGLSL